jgi:hypothetical protein
MVQTAGSACVQQPVSDWLWDHQLVQHAVTGSMTKAALSWDIYACPWE